MRISKKIVFAVCAVSAVLIVAICVGVHRSVPSSDLTVNASVEETEDKLRVFIGDIQRAPEGYAQQRTEYLGCAANTDADEVMTAVIGLNDYYTIDMVSHLVESYSITAVRVYMWPKGDTGRMCLYVENGDIEASINTYKQQVEEDGVYKQDEQFAKDYQRFLDGEYEVFALTVTGSAEALEALNTDDCVSYVDVMYNAEAEEYAKQIGKPVSYIELPAKPDGAL